MSKSHPMIATVIIPILFAHLALSQDEQRKQGPPDEGLSYGRPNGIYYLGLLPQERMDFLYGIEQGIALLSDEKVISQTAKESYMIKGFSFEYLALQLANLYADKMNLRIPIAYGYLYAIRKSRGDSPKELEDFLAGLRKRFLKR